MKLNKILTLILLFGSFISFGQEPKRSEGAEAIVNAINKNTKGISFILSDTGINTELNEIGTTFFKNKYIIYLIKKEDMLMLLLIQLRILQTITYIV